MSNPFTRFITEDQNPFLKLLDQPDFESSRRRAEADYASRVRLVDQLRKALAKPGITPERKALLERLIERHQPESLLGTADNLGESAKRFLGGAAGAVPGTAMAALDLALAPVTLIDPTGLAKRGREKLAEGQAALQEVTGSEGLEGLLGSFAGGAGAAGAGAKIAATGGKVAKVAGAALSGPFELFGAPARKILERTSKVIPAAEKAITGNVAQRVVGQAIADIPVNAAQALSIPGATKEEKLKAFAFQTAGSAAAGVLPGGKRVKGDLEGKITPEEVARPIEETNTLIEKVKAKEADLALKKQARDEAKAAWKNANPEKDWKVDLSKNEKLKLVKERYDALKPKEEVVPSVETGGEVASDTKLYKDEGITKTEISTTPEERIKARDETKIDLKTISHLGVSPEQMTTIQVMQKIKELNLEDELNRRVRKTGVNIDPSDPLSADPKAIHAAMVLTESEARRIVGEHLRETAEARVKARENIPFENITQKRAPGVGPEEPSTINIFKQVKEKDLSSLVRLARNTHDYGTEEPNVVAELSARDVLAKYDDLRKNGTDHEIALATIKDDLTRVADENARIASGVPEKVGKPELETVEWNKPLSQSTAKEIDDIKGKVWDIIDNIPPESPEYQAALRDIDVLAKSTVRPGIQHVPETTPLPKESKPIAPSDLDIIVKKATAHLKPQAIDPNAFRQMWLTPVEKLDPNRLEIFRQALQDKLLGLDAATGAEYQGRLTKVQELLTKKVDAVDETIAERENPPRKTGEPVQLNMPPEVVSGAIGMMVGLNTGDTEEERIRNAAIFGVAGALGTLAIRRMLIKEHPEKLLPGEDEFASRVVETKGKNDKDFSFYRMISRAYQRVARPEFGAEQATYALAKGKSIPAHLDFGSRISNFGQYVPQSDGFVVGKPYLILRDGTRQPLPGVSNIIDIVKMGGGDIRKIGRLAVAKTALERYANGKPIADIAIPKAMQFVENAPPELHRAVDALRVWFRSGLEQARIAGIISDEAFGKMAMEDFYTAIQYIFDGKTGEKPLPIGSKGKKPLIPSPNPIKERGEKGLPNEIRNPVESALLALPRTLRAAELNMAKLNLLEIASQAPRDIREQFIKPAPRNKAVEDPSVAANAKLLQDMIGTNPEESVAISAAFSEKLNALSPSMTVYRAGTLQTWRLNSSIAESFTNLAPLEQSFLMELLNKGTGFARKGIVYNPLFVAYQSFRDQFQASQNSQYGFVWGWDSMKAWIDMMRNTDRFKEYVRYGGGDNRYIAHEVLSLKEALHTIETSGSTPGSTAVNQVLALRPIDAYKTLIAPIYESARYGEYLRARGAGAAPLEAVYAAKRVVGNFQRTATGIKALSRLALFLNPAIRAMDESLYSSGLHPFRAPTINKGFRLGKIAVGEGAIRGTRTLLEEVLNTKLPQFEGRAAAAVNYGIKGFVGISTVSMLLNAAFGDDEEINQYRFAEGGERFWWLRDPSGKHIIKVPKPIFEGQLFGTTMEKALDDFKGRDPDSWRRWADAVMQDASMNLLPLVAAVPMSVWANKDYTFGGPIVPAQMDQMDPQYQERPETTMPARFVGKKLGRFSEKLTSDAARRALSPLGMDYIARQFGGRVLQESMVGLSQAIEYLQQDRLHPAYELPFIRQQLVHYPRGTTASVEDFYRRAERVGRVANTMRSLAEKSPQDFVAYITRNDADVKIIDLFSKSRSDLADMWHAINVIKESDEFDDAQKREITETMTRRIIDMTKSVNALARSIK